MQTDVAKKLFTVDEFYRMAETGIIDEDDRLELIEGEIIEMTPTGNRHRVCVDRANDVFTSVLKQSVIVSIQHPVQISGRSLPQADVLVLKRQADFYGTRRLLPDDVLLLIEVSDTTLRYDSKVKLPLYAAAKIREVWIEDLKNNQLHVYRDPSGSSYNLHLTLHHGDSVAPAELPDFKIAVDDLLG